MSFDILQQLINKMSQQTKQRNIISALQKREICLLKKNVPEPKNIDLAKQFQISPGQVTDILKNSAKWLAIDPNSYHLLPNSITVYYIHVLLFVN